MNKQPEALRLADHLDTDHEHLQVSRSEIASELRRLHAENQALNDALQYSIGCHREMGELAVRQRARLDELEPQGEQDPVAWCALNADRSGIAYFDGKPIIMTGPIGNEHHPDPLYTKPQPKIDKSGKPDEWFDRLKSAHSWK